MRVWIAGAGYGRGAVLEEKDARIPVADHGITVGDGVFETAKVVDGAVFALSQHHDRMDEPAGAEADRAARRYRSCRGRVQHGYGVHRPR